MPMYEFKCAECGLRFEKFVRDKETSAFDCLDCSNSASRVLSSFGFVFGEGETQGNTGVDSLDSDIDKTIGRDAERRWEAIKDRNTHKRKVQREYGEEGSTPLRRNPFTGEYEAMEKNEVNRFQQLHSEYADMYEEHKKKRKKEGVSKFKKDDPYQKFRNSRRQSENEDQ